MTAVFSEEDRQAVLKGARSTLHLAQGLLFLSIGFIVVAALSLYTVTQVRGLIKAQTTTNARTSAERTGQLDDLSKALAGVLANQALIRDCVGLTEGGECRKATQAAQAGFVENFKKTLVDALVPALKDSLSKQFSILKGDLRITVEQVPGQPPMVTIGGVNQGGQPTKQTPLPPGTTVQECVVELHAEPVVAACAVPRP